MFKIQDLKILEQYLTAIGLSQVCLLFIILTVFYLVKYYKLKQDVLRIKQFTRQQLQYNFKPSKLKLSSKISYSLWHTISALFEKNKVVEQQKQTYNKIISLTSKLTNKISNLDKIQQSAIELLAQQLGSGVISILLIKKNNNTAKVTVAYGLKIQRLQDAVLDFVENLLFYKQKNWGYHLAINDPSFNLSELGIGLTLTIPLQVFDQTIGGLWIGFNEKSVNLDFQQRQIIQGIVEYTAGMLVSAERTAEERKVNSQEKDFLIGLSHDLKTPGTSALYGIREIVSDETQTLSTEQLEKLKLIEQALEQQLTLVADVLEYAKFQKGLNDVYQKEFLIRPTIEQILKSFQFLAANKKINLQFESLNDYLISCDFKHFQRILSNLISNAIKYSFDQSQIIIVTEVKNGLLEIAVKNYGLTIPKAEEDLLFKEFSRLKNAKHLQGSGFGLVLASILAKLNSAEVFYTKEDKQTVFGLRLKFINVVKAELTQKEAKKEERSCELNQVKLKLILIIDDDPAICKTNLRYLLALSEKILIANSLAEARAFLEQHTPDLILTDLNLKDGRWTEIYNLNTPTLLSQIPTLILTGYTKDNELVSLEKEKHNLFILEKPITREELITAVQKFVTL